MSELTPAEIEILRAVYDIGKMPPATREQDALRRRLKRAGLIEFVKGFGWCLTVAGLNEIDVFVDVKAPYLKMAKNIARVL